MSNPILNNRFGTDTRVLDGEVMSVNGTISKTLLMLLMVVASASYTWYLAQQGFVDKANMLGMGGAIAALVAVLLTYFVKSLSWLWSSIYSIGEGFFLGLISLIFEGYYPGIVIQAIGCTFAAMFSMLLLYRAGVIRCTEKFAAVYKTAFLSVFVIYIIQFVASLFGRGIPQIFSASPIGIAFSCVVVGIAALGFIVDFEVIERGVANMAPKYYEWRGALGLMTSIVWLYVEILRLLAKLQSRN